MKRASRERGKGEGRRVMATGDRGGSVKRRAGLGAARNKSAQQFNKNERKVFEGGGSELVPPCVVWCSSNRVCVI